MKHPQVHHAPRIRRYHSSHSLVCVIYAVKSTKHLRNKHLFCGLCRTQRPHETRWSDVWDNATLVHARAAPTDVGSGVVHGSAFHAPFSRLSGPPPESSCEHDCGVHYIIWNLVVSKVLDYLRMICKANALLARLMEARLQIGQWYHKVMVRNTYDKGVSPVFLCVRASQKLLGKSFVSANCTAISLLSNAKQCGQWT